eukprot:TRINITY_DN7708_c0_g1_i1.p1 TRINITY_DN7708_c0_g1~~TRINITY_DN7708_c0_g1_i1.p1  ORF type:complete len:529 (+),score=45.52 TRINITY_DN7708_c0_g1_i1:43-1629(+)
MLTRFGRIAVKQQLLSLRWCTSEAAHENAMPEETDRNPLSTAMRQCQTRHEVADFILQQEPSALIDTHDLEAARMMANLDGSPLTSKCGAALEVMSNRMLSRFVSKESERTGGKLRAIVTGKEKKDKAASKKPKLSGSVGMYLEFASCYARIYYNYASQRGGVQAAKDNPLYILAKSTTTRAVEMTHARAQKMQSIDRPQHVPTAILALGLLGLKPLWSTKLHRFVCVEKDGQPPFVKWVAGSPQQPGWDIDDLTNVLWGCITMGLHKTAENRNFIECCLKKTASEEALMTCSAPTLTRLLSTVSNLKDSHGAIADAAKELFDNAQKRITSLANSDAEILEQKALPTSETGLQTGDHKIRVEDYSNDNYLVGNMDLGQLTEMIEAYNASGRTTTAVHEAVAGRIVSTEALRTEIDNRPRLAVELMWIFSGSYSRSLFDVLCAPLCKESSWNILRLMDLHRVLLTLHNSQHVGREHVFETVQAHLLELVSSPGTNLTPPELSSLKSILTKVGMEDAELFSKINTIVIGN